MIQQSGNLQSMYTNSVVGNKQMAKRNLLLLCGGKSAEHEISVRSAKNVIAAIDTTRYNVIIVGICRRGLWQHLQSLDNLTSIACPTAETVFLSKRNDACYLISENHDALSIDIAFPILHGTNGEDGTIQGLLDVVGIPYVGSDCAGSAFAMDKEISKLVAKAYDVPIVPYLTISSGEIALSWEEICNKLGCQSFFVKCANLGSSVGVYKVRDQQSLSEAIAEGFKYSSKLLIEAALNKPRELECAVLGNEDIIISPIGEIRPNHEFYSYEAKYLDDNGAELIVPANISPQIASSIERYSRIIFKKLGLSGLSRIDFFLDENNKLYFNEVNSIPGFTNISMYPKLFEFSGISYKALVNKLLELAINRFDQKQLLKFKPN